MQQKHFQENEVSLNFTGTGESDWEETGSDPKLPSS